jgi:Ca2+-transporting ATPase
VSNESCKANESSLTGEPDDLKKSIGGDCFLLSSCLITEGEEARALVIGIGMHSQWGKIKANLVSAAVNTPLQDKLEDMTKQVKSSSRCILRHTE